MPQDWAVPRGALTSSVYPEYRPEDVAPFFNIGGLWRWNNGADGRLDPGRSGQRHRRRNGGGDQRHGHMERAARLDDRLHDRARRRQPDPFERPVLSVRLEHVHGGRRRDRLRWAWRRRLELLAGRYLRDDHERRGLAARLLHVQSLGFDHHGGGPDARAGAHAGTGTLGLGRVAARRVPRRRGRGADALLRAAPDDARHRRRRRRALDLR